MNENLKFYRGNEINLPKTNIEVGALYHCEDTGNTYRGVSSTEMQLFSSATQSVQSDGIVQWTNHLTDSYLRPFTRIPANTSKITLYHSGKNLWNFADTSTISELTYTGSSGTTNKRWGYEVQLPPGTYTIHAENATKSGYIYAYIIDENRRVLPYEPQNTYILVELQTKTQTYTLAQGQTLIVVNALTQATKAASNTLFGGVKIQIEQGINATPYEKYYGQVYKVTLHTTPSEPILFDWTILQGKAENNVTIYYSMQFDNIAFSSTQFKAYSGINYIFSSLGTTIVQQDYNKFNTIPILKDPFGPHVRGMRFGNIQSNSAMGQYSEAHGNKTRIINHQGAAFGAYNATDDALFVIGNGTSNARRSDAFLVSDLGDTYINGAAHISLGAQVGGPIYANGAIHGQDAIYVDDVKVATESYVNAVSHIKEVTWAQLIALRDAKNLIPGCQYRIMDYKTTTSQTDTRSAGHSFDIIVTADSTSTLNENARAVQRPANKILRFDQGDEYKKTFLIANDSRLIWHGPNKDQFMGLICETNEMQLNNFPQQIATYTTEDKIQQMCLYVDITTDDIEDNPIIFYVRNESTGDVEKSFTFDQTAEPFTITFELQDPHTQYVMFLATTGRIVISPEDAYFSIRTFDYLADLINFDICSDDATNTLIGTELYSPADYRMENSYVGDGFLDMMEMGTLPPGEYTVYNGTIIDDHEAWPTGAYIEIVENNNASSSDYFTDSNLAAWELKYCLDNDTMKYPWADSGSELRFIWRTDNIDNDQNISFNIYYWTQTGDENYVLLMENGEADLFLPELFTNGSVIASCPLELWKQCYDGLHFGVHIIDDAEINPNAYVELRVGDTILSTFPYADIVDDESSITFLYEDFVSDLPTGQGGKGVIYYMKDEFGNECPYDFKNIQFLRYPIYETQLDTANMFDYNSSEYGQQICYGVQTNEMHYRIDPDTDPEYYYTFTMLERDGATIADLSVAQSTLFDTEGVRCQWCQNNVITPLQSGVLNNTVFVAYREEDPPCICDNICTNTHHTTIGNIGSITDNILNTSYSLIRGRNHKITGGQNFIAGNHIICLEGYNNICVECEDITLHPSCNENILIDCMNVELALYASNNECNDVHDSQIGGYYNKCTQCSNLTLKPGCTRNTVTDVAKVIFNYGCCDNILNNAANIMYRGNNNNLIIVNENGSTLQCIDIDWNISDRAVVISNAVPPNTTTYIARAGGSTIYVE